MRRRRLLALAPLLVVAVVALAATPARAGRAGGEPRGEITVSAAASLTGAFTALGERFERRHPDATVGFNFGSSSTLVAQIQGGAPADVFAAADLASMDRVVSGGQVTATPMPFARNEMQIAVKPGNPESVRSVRDLATIGTIALCGATAPCGVYAASVLERAGVTVPESRVTRGVDAKATIGAVTQGDANAAIVYVTDVKAAGAAADRVAIPSDQNVVAVYPIAPVADSANPKLAKAFVAYVVSPAGRKTLARYGFRAP